MWRFYQSWFICDFRYQVHREWLQAAVLARAIPEIQIEQYALDARKFEKVLFKPRGWSWIDPTKEVEAYKEAIKAGFTTRTDVIAQTAGGQDIEDIDAVRERELRLSKERGLQFDTDPEFYMSDAAKAQAEAKATSKAAAKPPEEPPDRPLEADEEPEPAERRVFSFPRK
jgi:capsid protein